MHAITPPPYVVCGMQCNHLLPTNSIKQHVGLVFFLLSTAGRLIVAIVQLTPLRGLHRALISTRQKGIPVEQTGRQFKQALVRPAIKGISQESGREIKQVRAIWYTGYTCNSSSA